MNKGCTRPHTEKRQAMKKMYYGRCDWTYSTIFVDQDFKLIAEVHENDGNWRDDYFNPLIEHFGIETQLVDFDVILKKAGRKLENGACNVNELDLRSFMEGKV